MPASQVRQSHPCETRSVPSGRCGSKRRSVSQFLNGCFGPDTAAASVNPRCPGDPVVGKPALDGCIAVGGQRDGAALSGTSNRAGADQLAALLGPDTAAAGVDPRRPGTRVISGPADDGGVAIGGQRDGEALSGVSNRAGADQLAALLGPDTAAADIDPRRPGAGVVFDATDNGGVAVGGQRDGAALSGTSNRSGTDQLAALLGPDTAAAGIDPRRPGARVISGPAHDGGVAVGGQRDGAALSGMSNRAVPTSLLPCWVQTPPLRV